MNSQEINLKEFLESGISCQLLINSMDLRQFALDVAKEVLDNLSKKEVKEDKYFTVREAMTVLHRDKTSLWRWDKQGILHPHRVGGRCFYLKSDIDKLMAGETRK